MKQTKIIATIGPASEKPEIIERLKDRGVDFFRINLSHTDEDQIESKIKVLKPYGVPIILDTEGPQVRFGKSDSELFYEEGAEIKIHKKEIKMDGKNIYLNPVTALDSLSEGDLVFIDFNSLVLKIADKTPLANKGYVTARVIIGGKTGGRKAVYVDGLSFNLPAFSKKDRKAISLAKKHGLRHFTLSFMSCADDVREFKQLYPNAIVYSKIESKEGLKHFVEIAKASNGILIDRGDLSHQIPLERIPLTQKYIIKTCNDLKKEIFVATNTLEQMSFSLKPNRAEVNDIINTILDGATGIALTKEVAVGNYPVETVNMLKTLISQVSFINAASNRKDVLDRIEESHYISSQKPARLLVQPHGNVLVNRVAKSSIGAEPRHSLSISEEQLMDVEQIAIGAFSPLEGFLKKNDFYSVLDRMRLANGLVWTMPIVLQVSHDEAKSLRVGEEVGLRHGKGNDLYAVLHLEEIYPIDKKLTALKIFGTNDESHPGVQSWMRGGEYLLGGKITLFKRRNSPYSVYELTPSQTRRIFTERGWSKVLAFHTRNVIHRSHEFIQLEGLKRSLCDGLFIHPVIGKKKQGDFEADSIVESYELMIEKFYPKNKVVLCSWPSYSRYGGPREAIFTALVRKNYGCSHFIVGRDHTGVGTFYAPKASHDIFDKFNEEELGIVPIKFDNVFYSSIKKEHVHEGENPQHSAKGKLHISGTQAREMLKKGKSLPEWFMRSEISAMLKEKLKKGKTVFVK